MKNFKLLAALAVILALAGSAYAAGDQIVGTRLPNTLKQDYTFSGTVTLSGTHTHSGAATFGGAVTLGDASADAITVTGTATVAELLSLTTGAATGADPADAGAIRMSNGDDIMFEASAAGTDINALTVDASEIVQIAASGASGVTITPDLTTTADIIVAGSDVHVGAAGVKLTGDGDGAITLLGLGDGSDEALTINLDDTANTVSLSSTTDVATISTGTIDVKVAELFTTPPAAQTIAEGDTIAADACGGMKQITAASGVTTGTTHTFTAPAAGNAGCCMFVVNVGVTNTITLDANGNFFSKSAGNVAVTANDAITVCSNGTAWYQITDLEAN
jgi:hypothetical protein